MAYDNAGLGVERPEEVSNDDDEFDVYRKRMMLAYRFRPNPLVAIIAACQCLSLRYIVCVFRIIQDGHTTDEHIMYKLVYLV